jgi:hypothetical protein
MRGYFLVRNAVALGHAVMAALQRTDVPEPTGWLMGSAETRVCLLDDREFERVRTYRGAIVISSRLYEGQEVAIAFGPRHEWPEEFGQFPDWFAEAEKQREDRENITEEKWLGWNHDPINLANFALCRYSARKIRLFAVACCDLVADKMVDARSRRAVDVALRHADGMASDEELKVASHEADEAIWAIMTARGPESPDQISPEYGAAALALGATGSFDRTPTPDSPDGWLSLCAAGTVSDFVIWHTLRAAKDDPLIAEKVTRLLRDICGNPFRPLTADPTWQSPDLDSLARKIYGQKAFDGLLQLADALEDVGCDNPSVLDHCRLPGSHVCGCWVVDLVLGNDTLPGVRLNRTRPERWEA